MLINMEDKKTINITKEILQYHNTYGIGTHLLKHDNPILENFIVDCEREYHLPYLELMEKIILKNQSVVPYCLNVNHKLSMCYVFEEGKYQVLAIVGISPVDFELIVFYVLTKNTGMKYNSIIYVECPPCAVAGSKSGPYIVFADDRTTIHRRYGEKLEISSFTQKDRIDTIVRIIYGTKKAEHHR